MKEPESKTISIEPQTKKILQQLNYLPEKQSTGLRNYFDANSLIELSYEITSAQIQKAITVLSFFPVIPAKDVELLHHIPEALRDHLKSALFLVMKCLQMKECKFE